MSGVSGAESGAASNAASVGASGAASSPASSAASTPSAAGAGVLPGVRVVDVHAHAILPALQLLVAAGDPDGFSAHQALEARRNGPESLKVSGAMVGARIPQLTQLAVRLADMDAAGIDVQLVSPSPSHYYPFLGEALARTVAQEANRGMQALVAEAPDRLAGLGLVPLQHPLLAVELLEHAVLDCGLRGVEISSFAPGQPDGGGEGDRDGGGNGGGGARAGHSVELSDERLEPFWARAVELGAVIFLHPFGCSLDERLDRFYLSNTVGQPVENAVALSHLIFAGVLDRHPGLTLIAAHGGGYLPTFLGRSDHAWQVRPEARGCAELPSSYLRRLYFDSLVHTDHALRALVDAVGADRVLLGSDYPFDMGVENPLERLLDAGLSATDTAAIAGGTAAALLAARDAPGEAGAATSEPVDGLRDGRRDETGNEPRDEPRDETGDKNGTSRDTDENRIRA